MDLIPIPGAEVYYDDRFLPPEEATQLFNTLLSKCAWERHRASFGHTVPRDEAYYGEPVGVMLHEMATGRWPFEGTSSAELVSAILRDTLPSVTDVRSDLPSDLARIIRRCLLKGDKCFGSPELLIGHF